MFQYVRDRVAVEKGKEIIRKEGINYDKFKNIFLRMFTKPDSFREDELVKFYNDYAEIRGEANEKMFMTVREWTALQFEKWTEAEYYTELLPAYKAKPVAAPRSFKNKRK